MSFNSDGSTTFFAELEKSSASQKEYLEKITAVENCSQEEQAFVYGIIHQNFLVENSSFMTEQERQANISFGMRKAEYTAEHFIQGEQKDNFLNAI